MPIDSRYCALLGVSSAIAQQSTVDAVLRSLRGVLSKIAAFDWRTSICCDDKKSLDGWPPVAEFRVQLLIEPTFPYCGCPALALFCPVS